MENNIQTINRRPVITGIAALLVLLFAYTVVIYLYPIQHLGLDAMKWRFVGTRLFFWLLLLGLAVYTNKVEHRSICATEQKKYPWWFYVVAFIVVYFILALGSGLLLAFSKLISKNQISQNYAPMRQLFLRYPIMVFLAAATAGVTEEYFFRGYLQSRLTLLFHKNIGIIVSALLFGLMHYSYGTLIQVLFPFYLGLIFSLFYDRYKNIRFLIVFHFIWDAIALYHLTHLKTILF